MKIEIDLNDILGDEDGAETLQESVRRQVVEGLTKTIKNGVGKQIDDAVSNIINITIKDEVAKRIPSLIDDLLNAEYRPVDKWGSQEKSTTVKAEPNCSRRSPANAFIRKTATDGLRTITPHPSTQLSPIN